MSSSQTSADDELPNQLSGVDHHLSQELRHRKNLWRSNYHEASIYIEEGLNNDKFENHPRKRASTTLIQSPAGATSPDLQKANEPKQPQPQPQQAYIGLGGQYTTIETYILVHNRYFYQLDLAASVVLLLLALVEPPAVDGYELRPSIHAAVEMFALGIIAIELLLKFRWMGPSRFFRHGRTVAKLLVLLTMNIEAIVIFSRHSIHARYSRALRPIFLIDNHYCHGLRRAVRQIFQSLPPIFDMFTLASFFLFIFCLFAFYLFAPANYYFADMPTTIGNLLILATTANLPDIMMPSYALSRWSAIFFVLFIIIHLFLFTNLTMAAVYEIFTRREKEKFHKLLLHRRKACQQAFKLLVSRKHPNRIEYRQFMGLMRYLNRKCSMFHAYLIFKALDTDKSGCISQEEFYQIYDFIDLEWKLIHPKLKWYDYCNWPRSRPARALLDLNGRLVSHRLFQWAVDLMIAVQALLQFIEAAAFGFDIPESVASGTNQQQHESYPVHPDKISTFIFIAIFSLELLLKCLAVGWWQFWRPRWNRFDLLVLAISLLGLINGLALGGAPFGWVIVLRVLRLLRLFEFKRRYKDMWQTLTYILLKRFVSMTCVVMILYYFFAIVGMELLGDYDLRNCCQNTSLESQFKFDATQDPSQSPIVHNYSDGPKYYLNDFGDLVASFLTLFSMTSNTYWLVTMSAYAIVTGTEWIRLFFALFYLCYIIVMNIVIAFILESFLFHINYRNKMGDNADDSNLFTVSVTLSSFEIDFLRKNLVAEEEIKQLDLILDRLRQLQCPSEGAAAVAAPFKDNHDERELVSCRNKQEPEDERTCLLANSRKQPARRSTHADRANAKSSLGVVQSPARLEAAANSHRPMWYLIFQAEQIRNKFSFTMKMYADEVDAWLAEAERADQDELSLMISRNQVRAEHVAMARLARRNLADFSDADALAWTRPRSWSTSGDPSNNSGAASAAAAAKKQADRRPTRRADDRPL